MRLPSFLPLSSNLLGIKLKWVKLPRCHETEKWIVRKSINEKRSVKCWVTKKMKAIFVKEDSSIIEIIWYLWPIYTRFTNFLVRWHEEVLETGCTTKTSHSGVESPWKWNSPPIPTGVNTRCAKWTAPNLEVGWLAVHLGRKKNKTILGIYNLCSSSACSCMQNSDEEKKENGNICYMGDKPHCSASSPIWNMTCLKGFHR